MSFPRYPAYKDSGVEWLGEVPEHWAVIPLGRASVARCDGPFGSGIKSEHYRDEGARVVRLQNIRFAAFDDGASAFLDEDYVRRELLGHDVLGGDVLIAGLGDENNLVGRACVAPTNLGLAVVKADCFRFRLDRFAGVPTFVAMQLSAGALAEGARLATGTTRQRIPLSTMAARRLVLPPLAEQTVIAAFLDRETAKIDALVAEQEKLIALLQEKRQAVISHAVTKGLDPNAPIKDSGVEWLGEVPAHWDICAFRRALVRIEQGWSPECDSRPADEHEWGVLKAGCVNRGLFEPAENKALPAATAPVPDLEVRHGDVLMSRASGSPELVGSAALVDRPRPRLMLSDKIFRLHFSGRATASYMVAYLNSRMFRMQVAQSISGAEGLANNLPQGSLRTFLVTMPPLDEQAEIVEHVHDVTNKIDALIVDAARSIDLLKERRAALISAAVTGQIDVRGLATEPA